MKIKRTDTAKLPSNVTTKKVDEDLVVLNLDDGTYFKLNKTGAIIWQYLLEGLEVGEVGEKLTNDFDVPHDTAARDVIELISSFQREKLINIVAS